MHDNYRKRNPLVWMETYGCQMNQNDSELIAGILIENGFHLTTEIDRADYALINTCSVRSHAEQRALGRISSLAYWKRTAPHRKIAVLGCMAQKEKKRLFDEKPFIDMVIGPDGYRDLPLLLKEETPIIRVDLDDNETYSDIRPYHNTGVSGSVTIMRGCDNYCTYCVVPYTRGRERSRTSLEIENEIQQMVKEGYREVTLLGQNVNSYHDGKGDFPELLQKISRITGLNRVRFMTSHPKDCTDRLFQIMALEPSVCHHLHLPVQSGSDRILKRMNRNYTRDHYLSLIDRARKIIPGLAITTDVIMGFPGETEKDFMATFSLMEQVRFDDAFMYHYSSRPGTAAAKMKDLPREEKLQRLNAIIRLQQRISKEIKMSMVGKTLEVMPETTSKQSEWEWIGKTDNNHTVVFPKNEWSPGNIAFVKIDSCRGNTLHGLPVNSQSFESQSSDFECYKVRVSQSL